MNENITTICIEEIFNKSWGCPWFSWQSSDVNDFPWCAISDIYTFIKAFESHWKTILQWRMNKMNARMSPCFNPFMTEMGPESFPTTLILISMPSGNFTGYPRLFMISRKVVRLTESKSLVISVQWIPDQVLFTVSHTFPITAVQWRSCQPCPYHFWIYSDSRRISLATYICTLSNIIHDKTFSSGSREANSTNVIAFILLSLTLNTTSITSTFQSFDIISFFSYFLYYCCQRF